MTPDQPTDQLPAAPEGYELFVPEIGDNVPHGCMIACPDDPSIPWEKEGAKKFAYYHFGPAHTFIFARPKSPAPSEAQPSGTEAQVCADIASRQQKGIAKYGTTVADNPLSFQQWLTHLYEEMLDAAVYAKRLLATPPARELSGTPRTDACESRVVEYDEYIKDKVIGDTVDTDFARQLERELALEFGWHVFQRDRANRLERELAALRQELEETRGEMPRDYKQAALELQAQLAAATSANETLRAAWQEKYATAMDQWAKEAAELRSEIENLHTSLGRYNAIAEHGWDIAKRFGKWNILEVCGACQTGIAHGETLDQAIDNALKAHEKYVS